MSEIIVRKAIRADMKDVITLIQELAEYEKMPDRLKITAKTLERDGFDLSNPLFHSFIAETSTFQIIGYALYYYSYSTWLGKAVFLEDLYVKPEYRNQGIGKGLVMAVAKEAYHCGTRLDFQVLAWNPAMEFYKSLGAQNLTETEKWNSVRLDMTALKKLFDKNEKRESIDSVKTDKEKRESHDTVKTTTDL